MLYMKMKKTKSFDCFITCGLYAELLKEWENRQTKLSLCPG